MAARVMDSPDAVARFGAEWIGSFAARCLAARGRCDLALPGGRSPAGLLRALAGGAGLATSDWARVQVWFADERAVPPDHPESNARLAVELLVRPAGIPPANVHRMRADAEDLAAAAREYEAALPRPLDLVLLGIGEDGHVASLFPGSALVHEHVRRVAAVLDSPKPPGRRLTLTPRALAEARSLVVLGVGSEKAEAVARALEGAATPAEVPARLVRDREWWLDRKAAALLGRGPG